MRGFTNKDRTVGLDAILPDEVIQELDTKIHEAAGKPSIFRNVFPEMFNHPSVGWKQEFAYDTETDMSDGKMDTLFGDLDVDMSILSRSTVKVVKLEKDFRIPRWSYENGNEDGFDLIGRQLINAAKQVGELENEYLFVGWDEDGTTVQTPFAGLYSQAGNDYSTGKDFGTNGYPEDAVNGAIALLEADYKYGPYKLILNPVQNRELATSHDSYGNMELPLINGLLNSNSYGWMTNPDQNTKSVMSSPWMTAGTGMMLANNPEDIAIYPGQDLTVELYGPETSQGKFVAGRVFRTEVLVIYDTNVISKLSSI